MFGTTVESQMEIIDLTVIRAGINTGYLTVYVDESNKQYDTINKPLHHTMGSLPFQPDYPCSLEASQATLNPLQQLMISSEPKDQYRHSSNLLQYNTRSYIRACPTLSRLH